jgi:hypothetical protein
MKMRAKGRGEREGNIQVSLGGAGDSSEFTLIFALDLLDSNNSRSLLVDYGPETGLALDDDVGHTQLAAESGGEDDEFNGSTSWAMTTSAAFLASMRAMMWLRPYLTNKGFLESYSTIRVRKCKREGRGYERSTNLGVVFLILGGGSSSGQETSLFLLLGLGTVLAEELEQLSGCVLVQSVENWAMAGGTLRRWWRMTFWRWSRTYSGHLTKWVRSVWGRMSWPMRGTIKMWTSRKDGKLNEMSVPIPKFLGVDSKSGFFFALVVLWAPKGAAAGYLPDPVLALGGWSLRRSQQSNPFERFLTIASRSSSAVSVRNRHGPAEERFTVEARRSKGQENKISRLFLGLKSFCGHFLWDGMRKGHPNGKLKEAWREGKVSTHYIVVNNYKTNKIPR